MQKVEARIFFERIRDKSLDDCVLTTSEKMSGLVTSVHWKSLQTLQIMLLRPRPRCTHCSTEFGKTIKTLANGSRCLDATTWRLLGDDSHPEGQGWGSQVQIDDDKGHSLRPFQG